MHSLMDVYIKLQTCPTFGVHDIISSLLLGFVAIKSSSTHVSSIKVNTYTIASQVPNPFSFAVALSLLLFLYAPTSFAKYMWKK